MNAQCKGRITIQVASGLTTLDSTKQRNMLFIGMYQNYWIKITQSGDQLYRDPSPTMKCSQYIQEFKNKCLLSFDFHHHPVTVNVERTILQYSGKCSNGSPLTRRWRRSICKINAKRRPEQQNRFIDFEQKREREFTCAFSGAIWAIHLYECGFVGPIK